KARQHLAELRGRLLLVRVERRDRVLELGDLGHQRARGGIVLRPLRFGDLLGGGVAARLCLLELGNAGATALVDGDETRCLGRKTAPREAAVERLRVFANPFDIVHAPSSPLATGPRPAIPNRLEWVAPFARETRRWPGMISERQN